MAKVNALVTALLEKNEGSQEKEKFKESFEVTKPALMSGFRGMFGERTLSRQEEERIENILNNHFLEGAQADEDCQSLLRITAEIRAISNQSILLHGERIKRAQEIFKNYKEGAFSSWLLTTYGNRQTPYSMFQYFELYSALPQQEKSLIEALPKKVAYTLAAREGALEDKRKFLKAYKGEKQQEMIFRIREVFPGESFDKRTRLLSFSFLRELERLVEKLEKKRETFSKEERQVITLLGKRLISISR